MLSHVLAGLVAIPSGPAYTAAKHGIVSYWNGLCSELRRQSLDGNVPFR